MLKKVLFDEFVRLNRGFDLPDSKIVFGKYPVVASTNIKGYHNEYKVEPPVVVTGRSGSLGKVQYISEKCWPLNTSLYSKDFRGNNPYYVYLFLQTMHLEQYNAGVGVPTLNQNHLHGLRIYIHNKPDQQKIVDILSKYDRLIETNNKRIKVLEQMAEELYKEWFVRFRFPGYKTAEFENGIPKGWECDMASAFFKITIGKTPPRKEFEWFTQNDSTAINWVSISDMKDDIIIQTSEQLTKEAIKRFNMIVVPENTILLSFKLTVGRVSITQTPCATNEAIAHFLGVKNNLREYLYFHLKCYDYSKLGNTSSIGNAINSKVIKKMKLILPDVRVLERFHEITKTYIDGIISIRFQNENLIKQRDLLLPRLMSGKLEV